MIRRTKWLNIVAKVYYWICKEIIKKYGRDYYEEEK